MLTEEQLIESFIQTRSFATTAAVFGLTKQATQARIERMRAAGIRIPMVAKRSPSNRKYNPTRVRELNEFIVQLQQTD